MSINGMLLFQSDYFGSQKILFFVSPHQSVFSFCLDISATVLCIIWPFLLSELYSLEKDSDSSLP